MKRSPRETFIMVLFTILRVAKRCGDFEGCKKVRNATATPAAMARFMISSRLEKLEEFASMMDILFYDDRSGSIVDKGRIPLKVRHATGLAQDWSDINS